MKLQVFSKKDIIELVGKVSTADSLIKSYQKSNYIKSIKKNLYACLDLVTGASIPNKYKIASKITDSSHVSHQSAFECYGIINQVSNVVFVASKTVFRDFEFEGLMYKFIRTKAEDGVETYERCHDIRVTDMENTIVDMIKDFDKILGFEELIHSLDMVVKVDSAKIAKYLSIYGSQIVYQKAGYLLEYYKEDLKVSDELVNLCMSKIGKSTRYLLGQKPPCATEYSAKWRLVVSKNVRYFTDSGLRVLV
ncbi:MAG TPA: hypothetical protein DEP72_04045 [Clostridiales bacterium]|nr:MAG: hypothetical protein A2Y18_04325 [Clostridiales bacterium GWD2_32_19]HCC07316.1 hypothetical protein [Clostridiales bacterium]